MSRMLRALAFSAMLLLPGAALAQTISGPFYSPGSIAITGGSIGGVSPLNSSNIITQPTSGETLSTNDLCENVTASPTVYTGLTNCRNVEVVVTGGGTINAPGYATGITGMYDSSGSFTSDLGIGIQGICDNNSSGTLGECAAFVANAPDENTGPISEVDGLDIRLHGNTGTIGNYYGVHCTVATPGTVTGALDCLFNQDPAQSIVNDGPTVLAGAVTVNGLASFTQLVTTVGTNNYANVNIINNAHFGSSTGSPPTLSSGALTTGSTDTRGGVTEGTASTGFTLTFHTTFVSTAPFCLVSSPTGSAVSSYSTTLTTLTVANVSATGDVFNYFCMQ